MNTNFLDRCSRDVLLSTISTFGIGGRARWLFRAHTTEDLQSALAFASKEACPYIVIGRGSNCLFADEGFPGLVIQNRVATFVDHGDGSVESGAGYSFASLGVATARAGWGGLEFAAGIPGSVGGAVWMNAGCHQQQTHHALVWVDYVEASGDVVRLKKEDLVFGYRYSSFHFLQGAIARVGFQLVRDEEVLARQEELMSYRKCTQPYRERSAGCVFRNPPGASAGRLIEEVGLKGMRIGGAEVSSVHANFIVNKGRATAGDVIALMTLVRDTVAEKKGVLLENEIRCIRIDPR